MKQAFGMVVALHVDRGDGEQLALQAAKDVLFKVLIPVGQYSLVQGKLFLGCISSVNAPSGCEFSSSDGWLIALDRQLETDLVFCVLLVVVVKKSGCSTLLFDALDGCQQIGFIFDLTLTTSSRGESKLAALSRPSPGSGAAISW